MMILKRCCIVLTLLTNFPSCDFLFDCGEDSSEKIYSDNKEYFAIWTVGSCGATTGFVTSVHIQKASEKLNFDKYGRIISNISANFRGKLKIKLEWDNNRVRVIDSTNKKISCLHLSGEITSC